MKFGMMRNLVRGVVAAFFFLSWTVPLMAQVSATFTSGAIAEYSNNANQNRNAVALASAPRAIETVTIGQSREQWGGSQGNDYDVSVTVKYYDGFTLQTTGSFNWVKNAPGGGINYFGIIFSTQPNDGFVPSTGYDRTYIFPVPGYEATFASLTSADDLGGSANFGRNEFNLLRAVLETNYGNTAELALVKSATLNDGGDGVDVGDTVSYTFTVENTGGLTVTDVTLTDNLPSISLSGGPIASLAPGAIDNSTFTGTYTITQTDIDNGGVRNTATVSGDSNGDGTDDVSDTSGTYSYLNQATDVVFDQTAALALVKAATLNDTDDSGDHSAGDTISYSFAIYNTGDQTVTGITISDPLVTVSGGPIDLASGASDTTTFTGTYMITQSDVDTGSVTNSAYVSGTDANGWTVSDTSGTAQDNDTSTVVTLTASPSIALIKGGVLNDGGDGQAHVGDTISYNFTITNTGNVTLSNIQISDAMLEGAGGTLTGGPISLAPGASNRFSFTGSYTLDADDISAGSVSNTATVTGSSPGNTGDVTDTSGTSASNNTNTIVSLDLSPSIEGWKLSTITDADGSGGLSAGDTIVYTISVKNTGNVVLTNVGVQSDTLERADGTALATFFSASDFSIVLGSSTTLNPGEVAQFRASYVVTQADIDAGGLSNTATVSGVYNSTTYTDVTHDAADTDGTTTNASDPTENLVSNVAPTLTGPNSSTGITSAISVYENQTAVFSFSANEAVTWTISGDDAGKFSINSATGVLTFSNAPDYENPMDLGDTSGNNTYVVVVTGEDAGGLTTSQTVTITVLDLKGSIGGTVTDSDGSIAAGVTVYLRDTSNNQLATTTTDSAGEYSFTNLSAATYVVEFVHSTKGSRGRSARGQNNGKYVQSIVLVEQSFTDVDGILIDPSGVVYNSLTRSPVSGAVVRLYVTRDDNSTRVEVQNSWLDTNGEGGLSGQTTGADGEYAFILNGSAPSGIYDIVVTPPSGFIFESLAIPATAGPYVPAFGAGIESIQTQSTAPTGGEATTYYLEFDFEITSDVATTSNGVINNHIPLDPASAELTITKTADVTNLPTAVAGDVISYTITVENTGNVDVTGVTLTDALTSDEAWSASDSGDTDGTGTLNVGETWTYTASYTVSGADITAGSVENVAYVSGTPSTGGTVEAYSGTQGTASTAQSAPSSGDGVITTLTAASAELTITKTADVTNLPTAVAGDVISYTITVENTGNVDVTGVTLTDALTSDEAWSASDSGDTDGTGTLNVGETWTFTASYAITSGDITGGSVENVAYATGVPASGSNLTVYSGAQGVASTSTSDPSEGGGVVTTLTAAAPSIALVKTASFVDTDNSGGASARDTIEYAFAVTNTGNVPLTVTDIADAKVTVTGGPVTLQPGDVDSTTFSGSYTITLADIVAGEVENTATVNAFVDADADGTKDAGETDVQDASGTDATNDDPTVTLITAIVEIALVKSENFQDMTGNGSSNDDIITYSFEVTNMGNVELTDVIVTDDDIQWSDGNTEIGRVASLMPGQSQAFSKTYQITDADINAGSIVNQAVASATAPGTLNDPSDLSGPTVDSNEVIKTFLGSIAGQSVNKNGSIATGVTAILYKKVNGTLIEVARTVTDAQGLYAFNELEQAEYSVEFIREGSYVYGQGEDVQDTNGTSKDVVVRKNIVESIVLAPGSMTAEDVDAILIDPSGVVYDSRTFAALAGAEVYLERVTGAGSEIVPSAQINGGENPVITGADGVYSFFISDPAPTGTYTLRVVKAGYETVDGATSTYSTIIPTSTSANGVSGLTFIEDGQVAVETGPGVIEVTAADAQPTAIDQAQYFGAFDMTFADWTEENTLSKGIIHNHIPIDMTAPVMGMKVTKTADISGMSSAAVVGETITYTITAENTGNDSYVNVTFDDPLTDDANEVLVTGDASLDPGEIWEWTTEYTLTAADIAAGKVENTATVSGTTPIGDVEAYESSEAGNMTKGAGNGSPTVVTLATLLEQIEDDLKIILADDLAMTMRQQSGMMRGYATGALARLKSLPSERSCAAAVNTAINGRNIEFDTASDVILAKNGPLLDDIAKAAMTCSNEVLTIGGHTDDRASEAYNQDLSERRAISVRAALAQRGVPVETLKATGFGELSPIASNTTEEGLQANRRVEFTSQKSDAPLDTCADGTQANRSASASATDSSVSGNGTFKRETTNCEDRAWAVTAGTASYLKTDLGMTQWMFDLSHRRERFSYQDAVRGWFVGAYGANNEVSGLAEGSITGYGLSGGVYGANRIEQSLFLDYYLGVAAGQHNFDLDFERANVITATGDYKYLAYFAGVALSGEKELEAVTLSPRVGVDLAHTGGADVNVKAQDAFRSEVGSMRLDAMSGARVFAELGLEHTLTSDNVSETTISVTPKAFCDRPIGKSGTVCGYGARVDVGHNNDTSDFATKFFLNYETSEGSDAASFGMSVEKRILNDMGLLSSKISASDKTNPILNLLMDLKF